jgi:hypothetical protein
MFLFGYFDRNRKVWFMCGDTDRFRMGNMMMKCSPAPVTKERFFIRSRRAAFHTDGFFAHGFLRNRSPAPVAELRLIVSYHVSALGAEGDFRLFFIFCAAPVTKERPGIGGRMAASAADRHL